MIGEKIGRYKVEQALGKGAMGAVYQAFDPYVKRQVAIKLLSVRHLRPEALTRFQREAEIVANLEHACIVPVYDYGEHDGRPYIVMQYMAGGSLNDRLKHRVCTLSELASMVERVAEGLDAAHVQTIIHRDIKPANILFDGNEQAYLADFGIAKIKADFAQQLTGGLVLGTPEYMSPEQVRGSQELDGRSDIYALGVVIFQSLTQQFPFRANTPMGTAVAHIMDPIPEILPLNADLPKETEWLLQKALAKKPEERFQTAHELAETLRLLADGRGYLLRLVDL